MTDSQMTQPEMAHREVLEHCTEDCQAAARTARQHSAHLLESRDPDTFWTPQVWAMDAPPGEIRLALAGYPCGRVPRSFVRKWLLALADAALDEVRLLNEADHL